MVSKYKNYKVGLISSSTFRKLCSRYLETNQSKIGHSILLIKPVILFQKAEVGTPAFFHATCTVQRKVIRDQMRLEGYIFIRFLNKRFEYLYKT